MDTLTNTVEESLQGTSYPKPEKREKLWAWLLPFGLTVMLVMLVAVREAIDPDLWWHLATGRYILAEHRIPAEDIFSFTATGHRWVTHEWLADTLLFATYRLVGHAGLSMAFAVVIASAFGLVYARCGTRHPLAAAGSTILAAAACMMTWGVRPQMLSLFFASLYLYILERQCVRRSRSIWLLIACSVLWANLHSSFMAGLAIVGAFVVGSEVEWLAARTRRDPWVGGDTRRLAWVGALCLAGSVVTPNGLAGIMFPFGTLGNSLIQDNICEWFSPDFHALWAWPLALQWLAIVGVLAISRQRLRVTQLLLLLGAGAATLYSARHAVFLALVGAPILTEQATAAWRQWRGDTAVWRQGPARRAALALILVVLTLAVGIRGRQVWQGGSGLVESAFPAAAVAHMREHGIGGRMFNEYRWGGYLIWQGYPVFIDGRTEVYGDQVFGDYLTAYDVRPDWEAPLTTYGVNLALLKADSRLAAVLGESARWKIVYRDEMAMLFRKTD